MIEPAAGGASGATTESGSAPAPSSPAAPSGGGAPSAWYAGFSDPSLGANASVRKFQNPEAMAKSYTELEKSAVFLPKDGSPEAMAKIWNRLGRPEKAEDYRLTAPKVEGGGKFDPKPFDGYSKFAHSIGLTRQQAQEIVNWVGPRVSGPPGGVDPVKSEKALRETWGASYDHNLTLANRAIAHLGGESFTAALKATGAIHHPEIVKFIAAVGGFLAEENVIPANTPSQLSAKGEYETLWNDPKSAYWDRNHPGHKAAVARITELAPLARSQGKK